MFLLYSYFQKCSKIVYPKQNVISHVKCFICTSRSHNFNLIHGMQLMPEVITLILLIVCSYIHNGIACVMNQNNYTINCFYIID